MSATARSRRTQEGPSDAAAHERAELAQDDLAIVPRHGPRVSTQPRLNFVVHPGRGPFALLVHGALGSRSYWAANVAALGEVCRPVVVELWGHGRSPSPTDPAAYAPQAYVEQFEALRTELHAAQWFTVGQSMGAGLSLAYGLAYPQRVLAQVITNSNSAFARPETWQRRHREVVAPMIERLVQTGTGFLREAKMNPASSRRLDVEVRRLLVAEFAEHDAGGLAATMQYTNLTLPLGERVRAVSVPTLLTLGVREETFLPLLERVRWISGVEVVELDAAHPVNAQLPGPWNEAVVEFFDRHRRTDRD